MEVDMREHRAVVGKVVAVVGRTWVQDKAFVGVRRAEVVY